MNYEIYEILEEEGYDVSKISDDAWDDYQGEFEDECDELLDAVLEEKKKEIIFEWAGRLRLKKKVKNAK